MMEAYFQGAVQQLRRRAELLVDKIPRDLPREFHLLIQVCRRYIDALVARLDEFDRVPDVWRPQLQRERLRCLRRIVTDLDMLENVAISALSRVDRKEDVWLNRLVEEIRRETAYPLLPPVATSLSSEYFHVYPDLGLLRMPLVEGHFLLHLPDLYHEMAHLIIAERNDPRVRPFQDALMEALNTAMEYFAEAMKKERRRGGPERLRIYMEGWLRSWGRYWSVELLCDLFGVYTVGPAFAWAHFHLVAKRGVNVYEVPRGGVSTHPSDDARMQTLLHGLRLMSFSEEAAEIEARWNELASISGGSPDADYRQCYPDSLLKAVAERALEGVRGIGCRITTRGSHQRIGGILNEAWRVFWRDPVGYSAWESETVRQLRDELQGTARIA